MSIPYPKKYMQPELGLGKIANIQTTQADSKIAAATVGYGRGVEVIEGEVQEFGTGRFFGIAIAREFVDEIDFNATNEKIGQFQPGEPIAVLRKGSIWIEVANDVKEGEAAKVVTGGKFDKAGTNDAGIGVFQSTAQAGGLAILQINLP